MSYSHHTSFISLETNLSESELKAKVKSDLEDYSQKIIESWWDQDAPFNDIIIDEILGDMELKKEFKIEPIFNILNSHINVSGQSLNISVDTEKENCSFDIGEFLESSFSGLMKEEFTEGHATNHCTKYGNDDYSYVLTKDGTSLTVKDALKKGIGINS